MTENVALVTGGSAGIGFSVAKQLQQRGYRVVITSRASDRAHRAAARLNELQPDSPQVIGIALDLSDLQTVGPAMAQALAQVERLDVLVTNAGVKIERPFRKTAQGFEWHHGINHLGHYLLTRELAKSGMSFHLTTVASVVARLGQPELWSDQDTDQGASAHYAASKLANLVFAQGVAAKLTPWCELLTANSAHPGFTKAEPYGSRITRFGETLMAQNCDAGARPISEAASSNTTDDFVYLGPRVAELWGNPSPAKLPKAAGLETAKQLFELSEQQLAAVGF